MRATPNRWIAVALGAALSACSGQHTTKPPPPSGVTPETHRWFPITANTTHDATPAGALTCDSCHDQPDSFSQFNCLSCHAHPQQVTDRLHLNPALPSPQGSAVTQYRYESAACLACHPNSDKQLFDHHGISDSCAMCHDVGTPFAALPVPGFTHIPIAADCGACHITSTWLSATGAPAGLSADPNSAIDVIGLVPSYAGYDLASLSPVDQLLPMQMNHLSTQIDPSSFSDCANCHYGAGTGAYYPGKLHSSLANLTVMQPTGCDSCHAGARPVGFVGPTATSPMRNPPSPEMKHDAVAWLGPMQTATALVPGDCGVCHLAPGAGSTAWNVGKLGTSPAIFHGSLAAASLAQPASCIDCHANTRPAAVLDSTNSQLAALLKFDHTLPEAQGDCAQCHAASSTAPFSSWGGAKFHLAGSSAPATCSNCHEGERPTSTVGWLNTSYTQSPFDYVANAGGIPHGARLDCVVCHANPGTGAWGGTQNFAAGHFTHLSSGLSGTTCYSCHSTQRPDLVLGAAQANTALGFDHSLNGRGDCFGCHQATVTANTFVDYFNPANMMLPGGDWKGGVPYPGSTIANSTTQFITVDETQLIRSTTNNPNNLVTSTVTTTAQLFNGMLHTSTVIPAPLQAGPTGMPNNTVCWHCHTSTGTTVTSFSDGKFHSSLDNYRATPGGTVAPFAQPASQCGDCHLQAVPQNIVQQTGQAPLVAMDHAAQLQGGTLATVLSADCSTCHTALAGTSWSGGVFHPKISAAGSSPKDCVGCHYLLMASASSDVTQTTSFTMKHRSLQLTTQSCDGCHQQALTHSTMTPVTAARWQLGAYHASVPAQPALCNDCHAVSLPATTTQSSVSYALALGGTATNGGQWLSHGSSYVAGKDCAVCHAADATATVGQWSKSDQFHPKVTGVTACQGCHGLTNGNGTVAGTNNNLPVGLTNSSTLTAAGAQSTVPPATVAQISHADFNVAGRDCSVCHTQLGVSTQSGVQGKEWAQAKFHPSFTASNPLVMNGTTGRCSTCHLNEKPGAAFTAQDHTTFSAAPGTDDCAKCHSYPGTGTPQAPNWLGATGVPTTISVGGFTVTSPPAPANTIESGIMSLPHPALQPGETCLTCHTSSSGGTQALGYDHASQLIYGHCAACHEAGSTLVGTPWNGATSQPMGAGDTRPFTLTSLIAAYNNGMTVTYANHFYPVECSECHLPPAGVALNTSGAAYASAWSFPHTTQAMTNPSTCLMCHTTGIPGAPDGGVSDSANDVTLTAQIPSYSGTTITSVTPQSETLAMTMVHSSPDVPAAANSACSNCHLTASQGVYFPGNFHSSLASLSLASDAGVPFAPNNCASCHAAAAPAGFVGATATNPARTPPSPEMKHDAVQWTNGVPTTTRLVSSECSTCHDASRSQLAWTNGLAGAAPLYHASLQAKGKPQPGSCVDCHANTRPNAVLTSANATLPANVSFDHTTSVALADCNGCHARSSSPPFASWTGGQFHLAGSANPTTCLPCHAAERPTSTAGWTSGTYQQSPFDYGTNSSGVTHGDGLDCATCHAGPGTGAWGGTQNWVNGHFTHAGSAVIATTCGACHLSQRPTQPITGSGVTNFDHAVNGTGDCVGCHQATVTANSFVHYFNPSTNLLPGGDWQGGQPYPGSTYVSSLDQGVAPNEYVLNKTGALVTSVSTISPTLYNGMLHTSVAIPTVLQPGPTGMPDNTKCWHCHTNTNGTVTSYKNGNFHDSLKTYSATPGGTTSNLGQPTSHCADCHLAMIPPAIVEYNASDLQPMDHSAQFTATSTVGSGANTYMVTQVSQADCSACHANVGVAWSDGLFHQNIVSGTPKDCVQCHYPVMADAAKADLGGPAGQVPNTTQYAMKHRSGTLTTQACTNCHTTALSQAKVSSHASTLWTGARLHPGVTPQPGSCVDCHAVSEPKANASTQSAVSYTLAKGGTTTNQRQWMNHGSSWVSGKDCAVCHATDAKPTGTLTFLNTDTFHTAVANVTTCAECHGTTNGGGTVQGTNNNLPNGLTDSTTTTSSSFASGVHDQIIHTDVNVTSHDCKLCHTPAGLSWAAAKFHANFTGGVSLVLNGTTGRCSNCHLNVKPGTGQSTQDHTAFTSTPGTDDCSKCHSFPGTGTASAPNWLGATGVPTYLTFGFNVSVPPATGTVPIAGINNLPHPTVGAQTCVSCHGAANPSGGKNAVGYDHAQTALIASNCKSCHEAGSNMLSPVWNGTVTATMLPAVCGKGNGSVRDRQGDTRPVNYNTQSCTADAQNFTCGSQNCVLNHFYPADCHECHPSPGTTTVFTSTGSTFVGRWKFLHNETLMQQTTCCMCHPPQGGGRCSG